MRKCKNFKNSLPLYLDDLLSPGEKRSLEEHLQTCLKCKKDLIQLNKTRVLTSNLEEVKPPPWFQQRIMSRVREEAGKKSDEPKWFYPLRIKVPLQITATVVIAVLAVYIYRAGEDRIKDVVPAAQVPSVEIKKEQVSEQRNEAARPDHYPENVRAMKQKTMPYENAGGRMTGEARDANKVLSEAKTDRLEAEAKKSVESNDAFKERKKEVYAPAPAAKAGASSLSQSAALSGNVLRMKVARVNPAAEDIKTMLTKYSAQNISEEASPDRFILRAWLPDRNMEDFIKQLRTVGRVEEVRGVTGSSHGERILVTVEIVGE